ncbi:MAG: hypothetical protein EZS28_012044 [Streblomastix strix]|uniref:Protein kinase domain-containing protein n=1 Tax=Streblomastix strix TaxID=222440 RepID=A0A5J4WBU4_9EUKA|nr:MAG: hypothetical protein EZS28_012044 [Streblomastix strix]
MKNILDLIQTKKDLPTPIIRAITKQILESLRLLNLKGLLHENIKGESILIQSHPGSGVVYIKIADYDLANNKTQDPRTSKNNDQQEAPEPLVAFDKEDIKPDTKADIYQVGIIIFQLLTHSLPFDDQTSQIKQFDNLERPLSIKNDHLWDLISKMLAQDPKDRISVDEALMHEFFTGEQAQQEITVNAQQLAQTALLAQQHGDKNITVFDTDPTFIIPLSDYDQIIGNEIKPYLILPPIQQISVEQLKETQQQIKSLKGVKFTSMELEFALISLSYLAKNQETHEAMIAEGIVDLAANFIKKESKTKDKTTINTNSSPLLLIPLFIYGTKQTQQLIKDSLSTDYINKLKEINDTFYKEKAKQLLSSYSDPEGMKELLRILRIIGQKSQEGLIEIIKAGFIKHLNDMIDKSVNEEEGEGKLIIIGEIIKHLVDNNPEISRLIVEDTDFIDNNLNLLNNIPLNNIKSSFLYPLDSISLWSPINIKKKLYFKRIIQQLIPIPESNDGDVRIMAIEIISNIIKAGLDGLKEGQQHPYRQQLTDDGTTPKLFVVFIKEKFENIRIKITHIFSYLYKAFPLPNEVRQDVIENMNKDENLKEVAFLAECPENVDTILINEFEKRFFQREKDSLLYLHLIKILLNNASDENARKIAITTKQKVVRLTNDKYLNEYEIVYVWPKKEILKAKAQELLVMINDVIEFKFNKKMTDWRERERAVVEEIDTDDEDDGIKKEDKQQKEKDKEKEKDQMQQKDMEEKKDYEKKEDILKDAEYGKLKDNGVKQQQEQDKEIDKQEEKKNDSKQDSDQQNEKDDEQNESQSDKESDKDILKDKQIKKRRRNKRRKKNKNKATEEDSKKIRSNSQDKEKENKSDDSNDDEDEKQEKKIDD